MTAVQSSTAGGGAAPGTTENNSISTEPLLTEVPSSLKQLARLVVRGFYAVEECLIIDMLVRYPCMREEDLAELLKFDPKMLRAKVSSLKMDKIIQIKQRIETGGEEGKVVKMNCYFINYKIFVNIVKYKLDHMHKKMETSERDATSRSSFKCTGCIQTFTDLEADQLYNPQLGEFRCTFCSSAVEEDESAGPQADSRQLLAKFNEQMEKLYELLKAVEKYNLAPIVLDPEPEEFLNKNSGDGSRRNGPADGDGRWSGEASRSGGFRQDQQHVNITFGEQTQNAEAAKEVPIWITQSTVDKEGGGDQGVDTAAVNIGAMEEDSNMGGGGGAEETGPAEDDEITSLLLKHEKRDSSKGSTKKGGGASSGQPYIPGAGSDSDAKSDESDVEEGGALQSKHAVVDDFAAMDVANKGNDEDVDEMSDGDEDDGDIPTVKVGNEEITVTDVNEETIARMTPEEQERYTQIYQDFYSHMYD